MQHAFVVRLFLVVSIILVSTAAVAGDSLEDQRSRFLEARDALAARKLDDFERLRKSLHDYPLYPYLEFWYLRDRLVPANRTAIRRFIHRYGDQPTGVQLRRAWLNRLADARDWKAFLSLYEGYQPVTLQCYRLQAMLATGKKSQVTGDALKLWMVGHSQDDACDPVFRYLETSGAITDDVRWQRIRLAIDSGNLTLADYLARPLPEQERDWMTLWREAYERPARLLDSGKLKADNPHTREIILFALHRLARSDVDYAHDRWIELRGRYHFDADDAAELDKDIALLAGWRGDPDAHGWLNAVPDSVADSEVREWRARSAISDGLWPALLQHIDSMPAAEAASSEWRYWRGIALGYTSHRQDGRDVLSALAGERDYYGFLAADELHWPYVMGDRPIEHSAQELQAVRTLPGVQRAHELLLTGLQTEARREWQYAIGKMNTRQLKLAALVASEWGWHDRAILTVARSEDYDDLELRFPLEHLDDVKHYAGKYQLDPGHVYAVIRTESAFNPDARSVAGAMGLMQLMPVTGRVTARKNRIPLPGTRHLYDPERNIRIGSAYLKEVMNRYDNNVVLASAAYNAGPQRVQRWLPDDQPQPAASWIAAIPFDETRRYVQRILAYGAIYDWRLQRPVIPLTKHMPEIKPRDAYQDAAR